MTVKRKIAALILTAMLCMATSACSQNDTRQKQNETSGQNNVSETSDISESSSETSMIDNSMTPMPQTSSYSDGKQKLISSDGAGPKVKLVIDNLNDYDFIVDMKVASYTVSDGSDIDKNQIIQPDSKIYMARQGDNCDVEITRDSEVYHYRTANNNTYSLDAAKKTATEISNSIIADTDKAFSSFLIGLAGNMTDSGQTTFNGKEYDFESYENSTTSSTVYFDGDKPVYIKTNVGTHDITIKINEYEETAEKANFSIPSDYKKQKNEE